MRVAILSDIHSNYHAFRACYEDAVKHHVEQFVFLGDYVSDLAEPEKTMDLVYEIQSNYPTICLRGNREGYMLACRRGESSFARGSKSGSLLFTYERLRERDFSFFENCGISDTIELAGIPMEIAHATKTDDRFYFDTEDGFMEDIFAQMDCAYLLTGHSHRQYIRSVAGKTIINPGSVGVPQGGNRWPKYAILDVKNGAVSCLFREVLYDLASAVHALFANGLVDYAKYWAIGIAHDLVTGDEWVMKLLQCVRETGDVQDEEVWHREACKLGMKLAEQEILLGAPNAESRMIYERA